MVANKISAIRLHEITGFMSLEVVRLPQNFNVGDYYQSKFAHISSVTALTAGQPIAYTFSEGRVTLTEVANNAYPCLVIWGN